MVGTRKSAILECCSFNMEMNRFASNCRCPMKVLPEYNAKIHVYNDNECASGPGAARAFHSYI